MGRHKTPTPKVFVLNVRLDGEDDAIFQALLRRRREEIGASEKEYTPSMFARAMIRKLGEEGGIVVGAAPAPSPSPVTAKPSRKATPKATPAKKGAK